MENDDVILLGSNWQVSPEETTKAKYFDGLFRNLNLREQVILWSTLTWVIAIFFFWPLAGAAFIVTAVASFMPTDRYSYRPGYSGRCPACRGRVRMEVHEKRKTCPFCEHMIVRKDGYYTAI